MGVAPKIITFRLATMVCPRAKVIGLDPIPKRIELAKEKYCTENIKYYVGYGQGMPGSLGWRNLIWL